jgi:hypothetical protein
MDGGILGTALIGLESVRLEQDIDGSRRRSRSTADHRRPSAVVTLRHGAAHALRVVANAVEPTTVARRTTPAES